MCGRPYYYRVPLDGWTAGRCRPAPRGRVVVVVMAGRGRAEARLGCEGGLCEKYNQSESYRSKEGACKGNPWKPLKG